jgi:hypothetical protein
VQDPAVKIAINDLSHIGPKKSIFLGKPLIIDLFKRIEMIFNTMIILRVLWFAGLVYGRRVGHGLFFLKQDKNMPDNIYRKLN